MAATDTPHRKLVRFAGICHVSLGPAANTSYLKSQSSIANAGSFEMHPAVEAMIGLESLPPGDFVLRWR
jgi:hypothetical protein